MRLFLLARMLCLPVVLFRGDAFLTGEPGASGAMFSDASKISDGSMDSVARLRRVRPAVRGVGGSSTVFRLVPRVVRAGAGVKSSALSLLSCGGVLSSSSDSSIIFFRAAALLEGLTGDAADILQCVLLFVISACDLRQVRVPHYLQTSAKISRLHALVPQAFSLCWINQAATLCLRLRDIIRLYLLHDGIGVNQEVTA
jgi:hypothetical protein